MENQPASHNKETFISKNHLSVDKISIFHFVIGLKE